LQVGAVNVPIYPTITEADYKFIFNDAEIKIAFVSDANLLGKIQSIAADVPSLTHIFTFDKVDGGTHWLEFLKSGDNDTQAAVEELKNNLDPEQLATIIYTSGTTGLPK